MSDMSVQSLFSVKGKVALVTGGSRGIGEMIAAGLLANGAKVYISARKAQACDEAAKRLMDTYGGECISLPANVAEIEGIEALVAEITKREKYVDILINNAGLVAQHRTDTVDGFETTMGTNFLGPFALTNLLFPRVRSQIINVGSDAHRTATIAFGS